jgi:transposase
MARSSEWRVRVEKWRKSGLTAAEYAERSGLKAKSLQWWRWRLGLGGRPGMQAMPVQPAFVEVVGGLRSPAGDLEVQLPGGACVRVPTGFDAADLARVLQVLEGR